MLLTASRTLKKTDALVKSAHRRNKVSAVAAAARSETETPDEEAKQELPFDQYDKVQSIKHKK